jgi:hypothetical protein
MALQRADLMVHQMVAYWVRQKDSRRAPMTDKNLGTLWAALWEGLWDIHWVERLALRRVDQRVQQRAGH